MKGNTLACILLGFGVLMQCTHQSHSIASMQRIRFCYYDATDCATGEVCQVHGSETCFAVDSLDIGSVKVLCKHNESGAYIHAYGSTDCTNIPVFQDHLKGNLECTHQGNVNYRVECVHSQDRHSRSTHHMHSSDSDSDSHGIQRQDVKPSDDPATETPSPSPTLEISMSATPTSSLTITPMPTDSITESPSATLFVTDSPTPTATFSESISPEATILVSPELTPSGTIPSTISASPEISDSPTVEPLVSSSPEPTVSISNEPSVMISASPEVTRASSSPSTQPTVSSVLSASPTTKSDSGVPIGAIIGGVIGGLVVLAAIVVGVVLLIRRNSSRDPFRDMEANASATGTNRSADAGAAGVVTTAPIAGSNTGGPGGYIPFSPSQVTVVANMPPGSEPPSVVLTAEALQSGPSSEYVPFAEDQVVQIAQNQRSA